MDQCSCTADRLMLEQTCKAAMAETHRIVRGLGRRIYACWCQLIADMYTSGAEVYMSAILQHVSAPSSSGSTVIDRQYSTKQHEAVSRRLFRNEVRRDKCRSRLDTS